MSEVWQPGEPGPREGVRHLAPVPDPEPDPERGDALAPQVLTPDELAAAESDQLNAVAARPLAAALATDARTFVAHLAPLARLVPDSPRYLHYSLPVRAAGKRAPSLSQYRSVPVLISGRRVSTLALVLVLIAVLALIRLVF